MSTLQSLPFCVGKIHAKIVLVRRWLALSPHVPWNSKRAQASSYTTHSVSQIRERTQKDYYFKLLHLILKQTEKCWTEQISVMREIWMMIFLRVNGTKCIFLLTDNIPTSSHSDYKCYKYERYELYTNPCLFPRYLSFFL